MVRRGEYRVVDHDHNPARPGTAPSSTSCWTWDACARGIGSSLRRSRMR